MTDTVHGVIPLGSAALCLNDETIFHLADARCPTCASESWVLVSTFVPSEVER